MKHFCRRLLSMALILAMTVPPYAVVHAEDTDLFAGGSTLSGANPNIIFMLDNSANWAAQSQHWTDASAQGQSELRALKRVVSALNSSVNVGLMMLTAGVGSGKKDGAYVRFAVRPMTTTNKAALQELIGDENCVDGPNSLNGTPNCIFKNFSSGSLNESVGANVDYSAALFEAYKYFGGYTNPANANTDAQPSGAVNDASNFGPYRYSGNPDGRDDPAAFYPSTQREIYDPPVGSNNNCAKNFIIFIGNGFPVQDAPSSLLTGIGGTATQLSMPKLSTTTGPVTTTLLNSTGNVCESQSTCATRAASLFPGKNSYSCTGGTTSSGTVNTLGTNSVCESASECATRATNTFTSQYTNYACTSGTTSTTTVTLSASSGVCESKATCEGGTGAPARFPGYSGYSCTGGAPTAGAAVTLQADTGTTCELPATCATRAATLFPGYTNYACSGGATSAGTTATLEASTSVCETQAACLTRAQSTYPGYSSHSCTLGAASAGTTVTLYGSGSPVSGQATTGNTCETPTECQTRMATLYPGYTGYSCIGGNTVTGSGGCTGQNRVNQTVTAISGACSSLVGQLMTGTSGVCSGSNRINQAMTANSNACTDLVGQTITAQTACTANQTIQGTSGVCSSPNLINQTMLGTINSITVTDTGLYETPTSATARWADEWAKFLYTTDVNGASIDNVGFEKNQDGTTSTTPKVGAAGRQNVKIYTLDVFKDAQDTRQTALLFNMAKAGGGHYYQAASEDAILQAINAAMIDIQATNTVFAAASLPVSATNRAQNENQVFFGLFRPDGGGAPRWYGNLKRYQVAQSTGGLILADKDGNDAINNASGFFSPCATSFWSTDTSSYWSFSPDSAGQCSATNSFSDVPDGPMVEKGGAAEVLRRGNQPLSPDNTLRRTIYTCASPGSLSGQTACAFNSTNVTASALGAADDTERDLIINYTKGYDVGAITDANQNLLTTDPRPSIHGDIVHSRPLPVNYGGSTGVVVYYGGNDGPLRAVKTTDGSEVWSFIAPEHHAKLKRLRNNTSLIAYPNVLAQAAAATAAGTPMNPAPAAKDYFFDGTLGLYQTANNSAVWIFPTMRRGGRMLYAFNVTDPAAPALLWRKGCTSDSGGCDTGFDGIGQTWSTPNVALTKGVGSGATPVVVVGGGYDTCEDTDDKAPSCSGAKGRKVYVLDAGTGAILASFDTERSVPADVALVDRDFDTFVDHAYVVDTGGNMYRIDFVHPTTLAAQSAPADGVGKSCTSATAGDWCITKIAFTNSDAGGRKFQYPPAVFPSGASEVILTLGSGDRERPLVGNYPYTQQVTNRFYMFRDKFPMTADATPVPAAATDLDDSTKLTQITDTTSSTATCSAPLGWRFQLPGRGEQVVTSSLITGGRVFFNTSRAVAAATGVCGADLGEAKGYNVNLLCASDHFSVVYSGGGLPISPVQGTTTLASGAVVTFVIGGPPDTSATSPFTPGQIKPVVSPKRSRLYWYRHGDK